VIFVLDASAMIAFLDDEDGAAIVQAAMLEDSAQVLAHAVNVTEVFYRYHRRSEAEAQTALTQLEDAGVSIVSDMTPALWQSAARLKSRFVRVSVADCFGMATALQLGAEFLTSDHHELEAVEASGAVQITFIR
jgi:predicted nucleic acid-binding protein